jgi:hypothetical protein
MSGSAPPERELLLERLTKLEIESAVIPELYERLDAALSELERTRMERDALQRENDRLESLVKTVWNSLSWRITAPLRTYKTLLRR